MNIYRTLIQKYWWMLLIILVSAGVFFGQHLPDLKVDAGTNQLLNENDPDLAFYNESRADWGYDEYAIFCVTFDQELSEKVVADLQALTAELETVEHVLSTTSILSIPLIQQSSLLTGQLRFLTDKKCKFDVARKELKDHLLAQGNLISADLRSYNILVNLDVPEEVIQMDPVWAKLQAQKAWGEAGAAEKLEHLRPEAEAANAELKRRRIAMIHGIRAVAKKWSPKLAKPVRLSGVPVININLLEHITEDINTFGIASFAFFVLAFFLVYRKFRFIALPILTCLLPVALIVGFMSWRGMTVTVITSNLPVLLFVLMLPYAVYFIERYRERRAEAPDEDPSTSTFEAARAMFIPCLFSCATTMAGFASLATSGIKPVRIFGIMMSIGMGIGLIVVFLFIPSLNRPLSGWKAPSAGAQAGTTGLVRLFEKWCHLHPRQILMVSALLLAVSAWGATRLNAETKFTEYFWPNSEIYEGLEFIDREMGGTTSLEIILTSEKENYFQTQPGLDAIAAVESYFETVPETGNVRSLNTFVNEFRKSLPRKVKDPTIIRALRSLEKRKKMTLTKEFGNDDLSVSRIFIRMKETAPTLHRNNILRGLDAHMEGLKKEKLANVDARVTGVFQLYANMLNSLIESQKETFLVVLGSIFLMLLLLFRSPILALLVLLPQVLPAIVMLGVMGWTGVPLDLVTVMIAAIAMGVGIDAAIQYTIRFRAELAVDGDRRAALSRAHATIGRAIWIATSVIVAGFCVLILSHFVPSSYFGIFTAIAMLMSQFAALTTLPALFLVTGHPKR